MKNQDKIKDLEKRIKALQEAINEDPDNRLAYEDEIKDYQKEFELLCPEFVEKRKTQYAQIAALIGYLAGVQEREQKNNYAQIASQINNLIKSMQKPYRK